ncbi:PaaI family thioesterase [Rossellomorea aquimaris]|uniref:PaaI family thioesterase n=1 Tax=Rossellomorea aquimaris TaxID=189382 RepID=UPI001CD248F3|nr:PaaI family thioesterase [Rossellomorea aquimaris]MCA1053388.1 PaaI family thioesterase [Rossellomorea aquimaris]
MQEELHKLLDEVLKRADEQEIISIRQLLNGVKRKQNHENESLIGGIFAMDKRSDSEELEISIPISTVTHNSLQIVHGGVTATLVDTAMGTLANMLLPDGYGAVTTNLNVHYLAPGTGTKLTARATVVHRGTKTMVVEGKVVSAEGKMVAHSTGSFFIIKK